MALGIFFYSMKNLLDDLTSKEYRMKKGDFSKLYSGYSASGNTTEDAKQS